MADTIRDALDVDVQLIEGRRGIFEVRVDDVVVASKTRDGFPTPQQCLEAVRGALV